MQKQKDLRTGNIVQFAPRTGASFVSADAASADEAQLIDVGLRVTISESATIMRYLARRRARNAVGIDIVVI